MITQHFHIYDISDTTNNNTIEKVISDLRLVLHNSSSSILSSLSEIRILKSNANEFFSKLEKRRVSKLIIISWSPDIIHLQETKPFSHGNFDIMYYCLYWNDNLYSTLRNEGTLIYIINKCSHHSNIDIPLSYLVCTKDFVNFPSKDKNIFPVSFHYSQSEHYKLLLGNTKQLPVSTNHQPASQFEC